MTTWTTGATGWALMDVTGAFVSWPCAGTRGPDRAWEPEGARVFATREAARKAARAMGHGLRVVQLVSVAEWDRQDGPQAVPMATVEAATKAKRRARDARRREAVA